MSGDVRPEVRRWGPPAGMFVTADVAIDLLAAVSNAAPEIAISYTDEVSQDVYRVRWEEGIDILRRFEALTDREMTSAILAANKRREDGVEPLTGALDFLANLRASAAEWESFLDPDDGSLELLIDA